MDDNKQLPPRPPLRSLFGIPEMLSVVGATITTAITSWFAIERRFGTNMSELGGEAKKIHNAHIKNITKLYDEQHAHPGDSKKFISAIYKERKAFDKANEAFAKQVGIHNIWDKVKELKPHQRQEVVFGAIAVLSVSLGVMLSVVTSKQFSEFFRLKDRNADTPQQLG